VSAHEVIIRQGGVVQVRADAVQVKQGGLAFARTGEARVTTSTLGGVVADKAELDLSTAAVAMARHHAGSDRRRSRGPDDARTRQCHRAPRDPGFKGDSNRVLLSPPSAFALRAGVGLVLALLRLLRRRAEHGPRGMRAPAPRRFVITRWIGPRLRPRGVPRTDISEWTKRRRSAAIEAAMSSRAAPRAPRSVFSS
jgi:hypothetical protein